MEYVMVPVPDEFVVDVMQYVARLVARASVVPWTKEAVEEFFDELEETNKALLSLVARYTVAGKDVGYDEAMETLELSQREIRAITGEINLAAQRNKYEPMVAIRETTVVLRNGREVQRLLFTMSDSVARMIRAHERADLAKVEVPVISPE
jgi:dsDNA-specific endonuclease/ATPase MutS2